MYFEMVDTTNTLLQEIAAKPATRKAVAMTYFLALVSSEQTDWAKVNAAIVERWGMSGLESVKKQAWRIHGQEKRKAQAALQSA